MRHRRNSGDFDLMVSVRDLVPSPDPATRPLGNEEYGDIHRRVQSQLKRKYRSFEPEVPLAVTLMVSERRVRVQGRLDGFRRTRGGVTLCEIKPVSGTAARWIGTRELRGARRQLTLYADLAALTDQPPWARSRVIGAELWLSGSDGTFARETVDVSLARGSLSRRLQALLRLRSALSAMPSRRSELQRRIPLHDSDDRPAQAEACERLAAACDSRVLLSMPPGSGKTRVALRHVLRLALQKNLPIYWITTKSRGRDAVLNEIAHYCRRGIALRVAWKTVAARTCTCGTPSDVCPVRTETENDLFWHGPPEFFLGDSWTPDDIVTRATDASLCPHELMRQAEPLADVVIADLNYVLGGSALHRTPGVVVLDEAQNLAHRASELAQTAVTMEDVQELDQCLVPGERHAWRGLFPMFRSLFDHEVRPAEWLRLLETVHSRRELPAAWSALRRILRLWEQHPNDIVLAWCRTGSSLELIATPVRIENILDAALAPFPYVLALSGSLPADKNIRRAIFPPASHFSCVEIAPAQRPPVFLCPCLDFSHPISSADHDMATECLRHLFAALGGTLLVFGQNRASNELLAARLRVRGFTALLDDDLAANWSALSCSRPDFVFAGLGGMLAESVNPPTEALSGAVVLSVGFAPLTMFDRLRQAHQGIAESAECEQTRTAVAEAVSRVIQAVGRVQRDPDFPRPALLLDRRFAGPEFIRSWPDYWRAARDHDWICRDLSEAIARMKAVVHAQ